MKNKKPLITIILGTRPEAIKLAPVIKVFNNLQKVETRIILTGQHNEIVKQVMELFNLKAQKDLNIMKQNQTLTHITCSILDGLKEDFQEFRPDLVLIQGDTSTAFASALSAFYEKIPIGHIEAGLRTEKLNDPFPEEANRRLISQISSLHFAPTKAARDNLINSGVSGLIEVTGNTVIDSLFMNLEKALTPNYKYIDWLSDRVIFVSVHRRENWGNNLENIIIGLNLIIEEFKDIKIILPMHPNSIVRDPLIRSFQNKKNIILTEPLDYLNLIGTIKNCKLLLTDSGGLQEEAPAMGKPVLVLRQTTERPEAIESGTAKLVGTNPQSIFDQTSYLLNEQKAYEKMSRAVNPFGDGKASQRILNICLEYLDSIS